MVTMSDTIEAKASHDKNLQRKERKRLLKAKKSRIIVRNLSFKANEDIIRQTFSRFGEIQEINVPKKSDGKMKGFCFVGFAAIKSALKAIKEMNAKPLLDRTIAVDFAMAQKKFLNFHTNTDQSITPEANETTGDDKSDARVEKDLDKSDDEDKDEDEADESTNEMSDDSGSDDDDYNESKKRKIDPKILNDASEEQTVFVRNLSFGTSAEALNETMKCFGETQYCKLCVDPYSKHSRGTAFVKFKSKSDADKCLKAALNEDNTDLFLDGRQLNISLAITRNKLKEVEEKRQQKNRDKRNLYLAKEGLIYPDSPAAEGVSQEDLKKRLTLETKKRKMLQNTHYFVSDTRLCVHNLPLNCDNQKLRSIFMKVVDKKAKILEARVMYDKHKSDNKFGKSKGFGFIAFDQNIDALKALRQLNNNPDIFTPQRRPIVEFSIENKVALNKKKHRMNKNADNRSQNNSQQTNHTDEDLGEQSVEYSGVQSRPNKLNEKIKTPKVNRKLGEMQKQLKSRKKGLKKIKTKEYNEKRHQMKVEKKSLAKKATIETQDSHDLHYKKRKNIFQQQDNGGQQTISRPKQKKAKWFIE